MKKYLFLAMILLTPMSVFSQSLSAYGVSLGDSIYEVENVLEDKGKTVKHSTNKRGEDLLRISNPSIGGASFDSVAFVFNKNDELRLISFYTGDTGGTGTPGAPWEAEFNRTATKCRNAFLTMSQNLVAKYGEPTAYSNSTAIWQMGNEKIELVYKYIYEPDQYGWILHEVSVSLTYEMIDLENSDF
ncbi:MAG: hypothetical protein U0L61_03995 [Alistipes sp.]|nr:hypothetical protein [Alistipes sp.]